MGYAKCCNMPGGRVGCEGMSVDIFQTEKNVLGANQS